ncbi:hypothetical protein NTGBS_1150018 [Candidatus Nitrotoga sp. BS]|uniref:hypothetical protein n=1 Tax=Candidatus Nitrotoga sp. BS TaxID=2890408 RepID=UPI001FA0BB32|nr:hypothetical protein [Candidatus Nitrotoga sp. BS]CAH1190275.1 hypothetical protein NTGBS_1150018 [Candidatus Nitrotoga sp. BS]
MSRAAHSLISVTVFAVVGSMLGLGMAYYIGLLCAAGIAIDHYTLIRERQRETCFKAFLHNNWFGAAVFIGIALDYLLRLSRVL